MLFRSGVSKYKERRRETENRLKDTRENLTRVEDILRELNANLERLEAQAEVAARYHTLQDAGTLKLHADDKVSKMYIERCAHFVESPPPEDWDGSWTLSEK